MKYTIVLILCLLFFNSCKQEFASTEIETSYKSVMQVHDEVMPEITTINKLQKQLKPYKESNSVAVELIDRLESAEDGMMDWMAEFKLNKSADKKIQVDYLKKEQTRINKVSQDMKSSISMAQAFLDQSKQK